MLRLCLKNSFIQNGTVLHSSILKEVSSKWRIISVTNPNLIRYFATESKQETSSERIYYGTLTPQIKAVKLFSISSSIAGLIAQPIIINEAATIGSTSLIVALCSVVGFFTFITPLLLHTITKKYVTEIAYEPKTSTYKATTISFFLVPKELQFKPDDVEVPDVPGMFTTMKAKGKPLFIEARHFEDPMHYAKIMGYDKPMDFKLGVQDTDEGESKVK